MIIDEPTEDRLIDAALAELEALPVRIASDVAIMLASYAVANGRTVYETLGGILEKWGDRERLIHKTVVLSLAEQGKREPQLSARVSERRAMTPSVRLAVLQRDGHRCVSCGAGAGDSKLHVDHKLAITNGGKTEIANLQTLCEACNLAKAAKIVTFPGEAK